MIDTGDTISCHHTNGRDRCTWHYQRRPGHFAEAIKRAKQKPHRGGDELRHVSRYLKILDRWIGHVRPRYLIDE